MDAILERKLDRCATLPTLPTVALKVVQLCQRDDLDVSDLVTAMSADPALSAKVLRLVNSAAFGQRQEVRTLSHAVMLLGTNALRALALSFSLVPDLKSRKRSMEAFWKRAVISAVAARELASAVGLHLVEEAFLCALLQDLGILALIQVLGPVYENILEQASDDNEALATLEHVTLGTDHAEVGEWLLGRWRLPTVMRRAAGLSHSPSRIGPETEPDVASLIKVTAAAGMLADVWTRPDVASSTARAKVRVLGLFPLSEAALETILSRIAAAILEVGPLFDVEMGEPDAIAGVVEQAKETLVMLNLRASEHIAAAQRTIRILEDKTEVLAKEAQRDSLTGLYNRRYLERYLEDEFAIAFHTGAPLTVVLGDVDLFKSCNDTYGHRVGDQILKEIGAAIDLKMRPQDVVGRYGGEEFLVVLPNTTTPGARTVAERMRLKVEALAVVIGGGKTVRATMSFGYATARTGAFTSYAELLRAADDALYAAKRGGRNRVVGYDDPRGTGPADEAGGPTAP